MKKFFLLSSFNFLIGFIHAQGIGIGTLTPHSSSALEITSTTQGILVPRMDSSQRTMIASPAQGLLVFDITSNSFWFRTMDRWVELVDSLNAEVHRNGPDMIYMGMTDSVGVGTSAPSHKFQVKTSNNSIGFSHTDGAIDLVSFMDDFHGASFGTASDHPLNFFTNSQGPSITLMQNGNVGLGMTDPPAQLSFPGVTGNKISLFSGINGENYGIGIAPTLMQFYTDASFSDIAFGYGNSIDFTETMRIKGTGEVGIGTITPQRKLQVVTTGSNYGISHTNNNVELATYIENTYGGWIGTTTQHPLNLYAGDGAGQFTLLPNGNVGINTFLPFYKFHVVGNTVLQGNVGINTGPTNGLDISHGAPRLDLHPTNRPLYVTGDLGAASDGIEFRHGNGTQGIGFGFNTIYAAGTNDDQNLGFAAKGQNGQLRLSTNGIERIRIDGLGRVMIGTNDPANGHILSVAGKIAAEEILVDLAGDWPDYVFEESYRLTPINELKSFIADQGHLPGVPSANDVKENGIYLGVMNTVLLEKIEELTLYLLQQEDRINRLESLVSLKK